MRTGGRWRCRRRRPKRTQPPFGGTKKELAERIRVHYGSFRHARKPGGARPRFCLPLLRQTPSREKDEKDEKDEKEEKEEEKDREERKEQIADEGWMADAP